MLGNIHNLRENWFKNLTGFEEINPANVYDKLSICGTTLKSKVNGAEYECGILEIPTLEELREKVLSCGLRKGKIYASEYIGDVSELHLNKDNQNAVFQVASQFNLLEMMGPMVTPSEGVAIYADDMTQGPICAISAGAGTIYRNYFAEFAGQTGQINQQIDCLAEIANALDNNNNRLWEMQNGYVIASEEGLIEIDKKLKSLSSKEIDDIMKLLRIGIQWNTEVTTRENFPNYNNLNDTVTQVYCSALPVGYSPVSQELWAEFAKLILNATYEATIAVAVLNYIKTGNNIVYLTLVGGGVFENKTEWIISAIKRALNIYKHIDLDVYIVSHNQSNLKVKELVLNFQ